MFGALLCLLALPAAAGVVDSGAAALADARPLLRFAYANDFFTGTDRYHTQGLGLDYYDPRLARSPLIRLLLVLPGGDQAHGATLRHSGFTPTSLGSDGPRLGDRPFAAYLYLGQVRVSRRENLTLHSELDVGILGQGAGGKWMQVGIHKVLGNIRPRGWDNQIRNDLVLDYAATLAARLAERGGAALSAVGGARLGTLQTHLAAGLRGDWRLAADKLRLFAYGESRLVGYDATLRGGLLNRGSPYRLGAAALRRWVLRGQLGIVYDAGGWVLEGTRTFTGPEFSGGLAHQYFELAFSWRFGAAD